MSSSFVSMQYQQKDQFHLKRTL